MRKSIFFILAFLVLGFIVFCNSDDEEIVGSVSKIEVQIPQILADGIATTTIVATIYDDSGRVAVGWTINFSATFGTISESATTDGQGRAYAVLTSSASEVDLTSKVTATISDTSSSLSKKSVQASSMYLQVVGSSGKTPVPSLAKTSASQADNSASVNVMFLGVTFKAELDASAIPADGKSTTNLNFSVKETTSKKAVDKGVITLAAALGNITNSVTTNNQGAASTSIVSYNKSAVDTIYAEYGSGHKKNLILNYEAPKLVLDPPSALLLADGKSTKKFTATLLSQKNTPVTGIEINFSASNGILEPSKGTTNTSGQVQITLTSAAQVDSNVVIIAQSNELSDTAKVQFIQPVLSLTAPQNILPADGLSQLEITANLFLPDNTPVSDAEITFSSTHGTINPLKAVTNSEGQAVVTLKSGNTTAENVVVTAKFQELVQTFTLAFDTPKLTISPKTAKLPADGLSKQTFYATLLSSTNSPIVDAPVQFYTSKGTITVLSSTTNSEGKATAELKSGSETDDNVIVYAKFNELADSAQVQFVSTSYSRGLKLDGDSETLRDGLSSFEIAAIVMDENNSPVNGASVFFTSTYGEVEEMATTDASGYASVTYTPDTGTNDAVDTIVATMGAITVRHEVNLIGLTMQMFAIPDSIPADGDASSQISVNLKRTLTQQVLPGLEVNFSSDIGYLEPVATTNNQGVAGLALTSAVTPGVATVTARYGGFSKQVQVQFYQNSPQSLLLSAEPNYIWVKETGNLEQTMVTATVLGLQNQPIGHDVYVQFFVQNGPNGGEGFVVEDGEPSTQSEPIKTVDGKAVIGFRAGTRSGTAEIRAQVVGESVPMARTTNIIVRSGPPYIWVDPDNKNNVVPHMTLAFDIFNQEGWNHVRTYTPTVYIGDKYNNPVELGTAVYFTTTGGIVTTDVLTDEKGIGSVELLSANPRPYLQPVDGTALSPHNIENPNDPSINLPIIVPDFEGSEVLNSEGNYGENDGMTFVVATTHGRDQYGNDAVVYATGGVIFSGPIAVFTAQAESNSLALGEATTVYLRVYDINGNPPAAGSTLIPETTAGSVTPDNLMAAKEDYGYGTTYYTATVINNRVPDADGNLFPTTAAVTFKLKSPNGSGAVTVNIFMDNK